MFDKEMKAALIADGEKLAAMTGEDHGPHFIHAALPSLPVSEWTAHLERFASSLEKNGFSLQAEDCQALSSTLTSLSIRNAELEQGIDRLAAYIMENVPGEPSENQGAVDTAIRLLGKNAELEREVKRLREAQQWQPIETAPQSVDILVGGYLDDEWKCSVYRIRDEFWREDWDVEPTHWQPLSSSPQGGEHE